MQLIKNLMRHNKFSVLISIYQKESPQFLNLCLESIHQQSLQPDEIVIVEDGSLTEGLYEILKLWKKVFGDALKTIPLTKNSGLGKALKVGVIGCKHEFIARMDADDICFQDRFHKQINFLTNHPEIDIISSWIDEFISDPSEIIAIRKVPEHNEDIVSFHKKRNALNHMAVVFKKSKIIAAGNYTHMPYFEDYFLWSRMMKMGVKFYNIQESLVFARIGIDMIGRRHGLSYIEAEFNNCVALRKIDFINNFEMIKMLALRLPLRIIPKSILKWLYKNFIH